MIERRRAPEFAAAAAAGEDDDDDDDETERRGSLKGKQGGPPGPGKSLKGKESFKTRQPSRSDYAKAKRRRKDRRAGSERRGFIEGLVSHPSSDEDEDEKPVLAPHDRGQRHESVSTLVSRRRAGRC
jgi:MADS-box transcription factor